ncbi:DNA-directed RNA polymerase subunit beta'' [Dissostichus eleginoides]|uniref:DNA-directed RNA polymerase subunit beta n=1 Tax=Dissostichus eleginoides TaxID=100907 RepID=A0AAD9BPC5_DISEL|nr:DNA-directed RNA polymerase subunit beta'' [Dissostichus eleginoides]
MLKPAEPAWSFVNRSSFASRRRTASQGLFKGSANPIRLLICEALSPRTPASVGTTSWGITGLLVVIGGDRESEGKREEGDMMRGRWEGKCLGERQEDLPINQRHTPSSCHVNGEGLGYQAH